MYFFVGYFGGGWPEQYQNRMFIYRGAEFERLDSLADRIQLGLIIRVLFYYL